MTLFNSKIKVVQVSNEGELSSALAIREIVFIEEQRVPESLERDEEDSNAFHLLAYEGGHAIGTGRLVQLGVPPKGEVGTWGRIGRMAVLASWRTKGVGSMLLNDLEAEARRRQLDGLFLHAQLFTRGFYLGAGYEAAGQIFEEVGVPHVEMRKRLR
jgi:predicted GNAT family N-acyltransferase